MAGVKNLARRQDVNHARRADINLNTLELSLPLVGKFRDKPLRLQLFSRGEVFCLFIPSEVILRIGGQPKFSRERTRWWLSLTGGRSATASFRKRTYSSRGREADPRRETADCETLLLAEGS